MTFMGEKSGTTGMPWAPFTTRGNARGVDAASRGRAVAPAQRARLERDGPRDDAPVAGAGAVLEPGRNCWRIAPAARAAVLVDGCAYFAALEAALRKAERSIVVIGWDFDGRIRLRPDDAAGDTAELGPLLRQMVEARPALEVRILVWSSAVVHAPSATTELLVGESWQKHPRITLRLDTTHPLYAAHHQKLVVIDDALAFAGGTDLTVDRWDTPRHRPDDPHRRLPEGKPYEPVHDLMLMLEGEAARACAAIARERWQEGTGETLRPVAGEARSLWNPEHAPHFEGAAIGLARSMPAWRRGARVAEAPRLTSDLLYAARRCLYLETQYLTAGFVGDILEQRLSEPDGPEVVAIVSYTTHSKLEQMVMGTNRDRLVRRLARADRYGRLRVCHPMIRAGDAEYPILVHSKLIIADDTVLRIGSSNLNNRSVGLDSELDLAIEAGNADERAAIARVRDALVAEHLGSRPETVARLYRESGSLISTIDALSGGQRGLSCFQSLKGRGPTRPIFGTSLLDPARPFALFARPPRESFVRR